MRRWRAGLHRRFFHLVEGDTAIATANKNSIHGVAAGTTNHYAQSDPMYWGIRKAFNICPISRPQTTANTNVGQAMTLVGTNCNANPTFSYGGNYFNKSGTCRLPSNIAVPSGGSCVNVGFSPAAPDPKTCYRQT